MLYAIIGQDSENSLEKRLAARPDHIKRLEALKQEGRLFVAGPFPVIDNSDPGPAGFSGSLIVAEFDSIEAAQTWADQDPYVAAGVYESVTIKAIQKGVTLK